MPAINEMIPFLLLMMILIVTGILLARQAVDRLAPTRKQVPGKIHALVKKSGMVDHADRLLYGFNQAPPSTQWFAYVKTPAEMIPVEISEKVFHSLGADQGVIVEIEYGRFTGKRHRISLVEKR